MIADVAVHTLAGIAAVPPATCGEPQPMRALAEEVLIVLLALTALAFVAAMWRYER